MTSASDIIRLRCLLGALSLSGSTFFANSFSSSLQKSSAMQKISVILSLLIISNLFFYSTIKLLIINELAKGKTNYFSSFYLIFLRNPYPELALFLSFTTHFPTIVPQMWLLQAILTSNSMTCEYRVLNFVLHSVGHFQKRELAIEPKN